MSVYSDLTDEELEAEIADLRSRIRGAPGSPAVKSVAGEGRRVEYENMSSHGLRRLLTDALNEQERRNGTGLGGAAIGVRFV
jgi:hypothetical protein